MNNQVCDPGRISSFVREDLSPKAEQALIEHLNHCETCGQSLEREVAEAAAWREASELLGDGSLAESSLSVPSQFSRSDPIHQVLAQLSPTDDPDSLGRIDGYEVTGVIGSGGMGVVLKAIDPPLDRVVAIKVLTPHLATSGSARQRFAREAKAAAAVLHPNVIAIHGVSNQHALPYLVMPFVKGESLQKRIDNHGTLPLLDILRIGSQVAAGLAAAHEQGLVHRDIKPANILLEQGVERVTLTDFGLARAVDDASMTRSGVIAGTPQYMSPEQGRGESVEQSSDLFSLGSVLYTLATGRPPFRADSSLGVIRKISEEAPTPIRELNPDMPEWLGVIIDTLMAKEKNSRFKSAAEVHALLEACLSHAQQPTVFPLPALPLLHDTKHPHPFSKIFAGVTFMVTIALGLLYLVSNPSTPLQEPVSSQTASSETFTKEFILAFPDPDEGGTLNVDIKRGSIEIVGYDGDKVIVELAVPNFSPAESQSGDGLTELRPNTLDFDIESTQSAIKVDGNSYEHITNLTIKVPRKTHLILDSYRDGAIHVRGVEGTFDVRSQNNDIQLEGVSGPTHVRAYNGNVTASFISIAGDAPLSFESYNGSIDVTLPAITRADVRYRSGYGKVFTDFDVTLEEDTIQVDGETRMEFADFVQGKINGGGVTLTLDTEKGDIRLRKQESSKMR